MDEAQTAVGYPNGFGQGPDCGHTWCRLTPNYPPITLDDITAFQKLIPAIGIAIGNAAAHEAGHYLQGVQAFQGKVFPNMDCGLANTQALVAAIPCETDPRYPNGDNFVYNFFSGIGLPQDPSGPPGAGGMFFYGVPGGTLGVPVQTPIHWAHGNECWLQNYAAPGSCKK